MSENLGAQGVEETQTAAPVVAETDAPIEGAEALGDAGKKALDSMKAKWKESDAKAKAFEAELSALKAAAEGREAEHKASQEAQKIRDEALATANDRIKKSEIRAAAKGELANPEDALVFLDLSEIEVSDDGSVDSDAISQAIRSLLEERPYLAAQGERRFTGSVDAGPRNGGVGGVEQLTASDLDRMTPAQVVEARKAGRLKNLLG